MQSAQNSNKNFTCSICQLSEIDDLNYGEIHYKKDLSVHLFCLYFSTELPQRAQSSSGILGFKLRDIRNLKQNSIRSKCCYCDRGSATSHCQAQNCGRVFHQVCGFKADARFEYLDHFQTFCDLHNQIDESEDFAYPDETYGCWICYEALGNYHPVKTVPSCCKRWFHQQCLRNYAINAGYAFMCPLCRNKNYADFARRHGIYVPEYEALWEKTHNFADIECFYTRCDSENCLCPLGRTFTNYKWILKLCSQCGSYGLHTLCRPVDERFDEIICDVCSNILAELAQRTRTGSVNESRIVQTSSNQADVTPIEAYIDLTQEDDNISESRRSQITNNNPDVFTMALDVYMNVTEENKENNVFEQNIQSDDEISETLGEKRLREKKERPIRDEMRQFRLSLLFR